MSVTKSVVDESTNRLALVQRAYEREKARRKYAEKMLEDKSRTLYLSELELKESNQALTDASCRLRNQNAAFVNLNNDYDRVKEDLSYAAKIQAGLLPPPLDIKNVSATGQVKPAQFIAGDGFDYFLLRDDVLVFYIVDVAGHGIAAAMTSFAIQIQLNPKADGLCQKHLPKHGNLDDAVANTINELNQIFSHEHPDAQYFTMIYGLINLNNGEVSFAQAGHPPPLLWCSQSGKASPQGKGGTPVAMFDTPLFGFYKCQLTSGDRLLIYSDGVTECRNKNDKEFGTENLINELQKLSNKSIQQSTDSISDSITAWNGSTVFEDDLSILLLEYR